jgi:hypothetical protein
MTVAATRNGFAAPLHRLSLWTAIKKLIGPAKYRGAMLLTPLSRFDNSAKFDYPCE